MVNLRLSKDTSVTALLDPGFSRRFKSNFGGELGIPALMKYMVDASLGRSVAMQAVIGKGTGGGQCVPGTGSECLTIAARPCSAQRRVCDSIRPVLLPLTSFRFSPSFQGCERELFSLDIQPCHSRSDAESDREQNLPEPLGWNAGFMCLQNQATHECSCFRLIICLSSCVNAMKIKPCAWYSLSKGCMF